MTANAPHVGRMAPWTRKHYREVMVVRGLLAPWILFVVVVLCARGYWWGLAFLPFLALDLWLLRRIVQYARAQSR